MLGSWEKTILRLLCPHDVNMSKRRIGSDTDGGYVICDQIEPDALYSYGSNDNISFEKSFYDIYKKPSFVYDHTIEKITDKPDYVNFFKEGVGVEKTDELDTIKNHLEKNGHSDNKNLVMQMDIEGCEWDVLEYQPIENFVEMVIEFHLYPSMFADGAFADKVLNTITYINKYFVPVHVHGNNACSLENKPWLTENIPMCLEVTFMRKDVISKCMLDTHDYPDPELDKDNNPELPTMKLNWHKI
jgi:hypothetical protein